MKSKECCKNCESCVGDRTNPLSDYWCDNPESSEYGWIVIGDEICCDPSEFKLKQKVEE